MSFPPVHQIRSTAFALPRRDVDTDQIIPARFLTTTTRDGLGRAAFADWRFAEDGASRGDDPFAGHDMSGRSVLVAGDNFGCGSSREHAPWALRSFGVEAVISTKIADIFRSNALKNGLVAIEVPPDVHTDMMARHGEPITVDVEAQEIRYANQVVSFSLDPFARTCLMQGTDPMGFLLDALPEIEAFESRWGR